MSEAATVTFDEIQLDTMSSEDITSEFVRWALRLPASDLFVEAQEASAAIKARHLGLQKQLTSSSRETGRRIINHFKAVAGMDLSAGRRPQDGRIVLPSGEERVDVRINIIPTLYGEDMALRFLRRSIEKLDLPNIGFHRKELNDVFGLLSRPSGLLLVTGPTGSGKTTTMYACLQHLNNGMRKINTIEDPVEYALDGVRQSQVNPRIGLDFPEMLRSVLRQAPDVILIGEVRDSTTAETAVQAANSGLLVMATLHAPTAAAAVDSLLAYGVHPHFLATCLLGVMSQRLVRTLCTHCKTAYDLSASPETFADVRRWLDNGEGDAIYSAPGCDHCFYEGYTDRSGVFEVMPMTSEIRQMILARQSAEQLREKAIEQGMLDMRRSALLKVAKGITSIEEVVRMISTEHLLPN